MEFEYTPLAADVEFVLSKPALGGLRMYQANIRLNLPNGVDTVYGLKVISIDEVEDYAKNFSTVKTIEIYVGLGTYAKRIYPNRDKLELELSSLTSNTGDGIVTEVYDAVLLDSDNPMMDESSVAMVSEAALDITDLKKITLQLKHKALEGLRVSSIAGIHRERTVEEVLKLSFTQAIQNLEVEDSYQPTGVTISAGANDNVYDHIIIPHGTKLQDLPGYLQEKQYGVYPSGMGHYYKEGSWYIYPLYDSTRYSEELRTLEISLIPENKLAGVDHTFRKEGGVTYILATGNRLILNEPEKEAQEKGDGVRFSDPVSLFERFADVLSQVNKAFISRGNNTTEITTTAEDTGQAVNAPVSVNPITANKYRELSHLARRQGMFFNFVWEYSDPSVLYPGMLMRVKFIENGEIRYFEAVLLGAYSSMQLIGKGITSDRYYCSTALSVFLTKDLG